MSACCDNPDCFGCGPYTPVEEILEIDPRISPIGDRWIDLRLAQGMPMLSILEDGTILIQGVRAHDGGEVATAIRRWARDWAAK